VHPAGYVPGAESGCGGNDTVTFDADGRPSNSLVAALSSLRRGVVAPGFAPHEGVGNPATIEW
jgi:hypothetical protein